MILPVLTIAALLTTATAKDVRSEKKDSLDLALSSYQLSREILHERWSESWGEHADLPCKQPTFRGFVPKMAMPSQSPTFNIQREDALKLVEDEFPVYSFCQVFISHKWRFIYVRQPKSSSTAILSSIKYQLCGVKSYNEDCGDDTFRLATPSEVQSDVWKDYFVFTFVRNPWTRARSGYKFLSGYLRKRTGSDALAPGKKCGLEFEVFTENSNNLREICETDQCCVYMDKTGEWHQYFVDAHISDQAHCAFLPSGESMVDFIGASETVDEDWEKVVTHINDVEGTTFQAAPVDNANVRGESTKTGAPVSCETDKERITGHFDESKLYGIAAQYSMDVIKFGYM